MFPLNKETKCSSWSKWAYLLDNNKISKTFPANVLSKHTVTEDVPLGCLLDENLWYWMLFQRYFRDSHFATFMALQATLTWQVSPKLYVMHKVCSHCGCNRIFDGIIFIWGKETEVVETFSMKGKFKRSVKTDYVLFYKRLCTVLHLAKALTKFHFWVPQVLCSLCTGKGVQCWCNMENFTLTIILLQKFCRLLGLYKTCLLVCFIVTLFPGIEGSSGWGKGVGSGDLVVSSSGEITVNTATTITSPHLSTCQSLETSPSASGFVCTPPSHAAIFPSSPSRATGWRISSCKDHTVVSELPTAQGNQYKQKMWTGPLKLTLHVMMEFVEDKKAVGLAGRGQHENT